MADQGQFAPDLPAHVDTPEGRDDSLRASALPLARDRAIAPKEPALVIDGPPCVGNGTSDDRLSDLVERSICDRSRFTGKSPVPEAEVEGVQAPAPIAAMLHQSEKLAAEGDGLVDLQATLLGDCHSGTVVRKVGLHDGPVVEEPLLSHQPERHTDGVVGSPDRLMVFRLRDIA